jgi:predicted ATPase
MISLIEALNFRCLRYVRQPLQPFQVLLGPNASGKTTFLDVVAFLGRLVSDGIETAVEERTSNFSDLLWKQQGDRFELAIEATIPDERRAILEDQDFDRVRYEVAVGIEPSSHEVQILAEKVLLLQSNDVATGQRQRDLFPDPTAPPDTIIPTRRPGARKVINKVPDGNDQFNPESRSKAGKGWTYAFNLGPRKSALGNLPSDESKFPVSTWLRELLTQGVQPFVLNSLLIRKASAPTRRRGFKTDGSNLPWVVADLQRKAPKLCKEWIDHLRTALPDIVDVHVRTRPDDRHAYLVIENRDGLFIPSWMASDGTLRMLALTLPAYLPGFQGVYLIEEPENGIHPRAVEAVFLSLTSAYDAQILLASHSPVVLSCARVDDILCFAKSAEGATDIVRGPDHPRLREWRSETNLGLLFAAGVLG